MMIWLSYTCAGKWKISRKYGGICGQGEGRMKRIVDKGLLLAGGSVYGGTVGKACSAGHSVAVGDDCGGIWQLCGQQTMALCVCLAGMFAVCFILPELCFFRVPVSSV